MNVTEVLGRTTDALTVRRVFGEPFEKNGLTIIPVAEIGGAGGAGTGHDDKGQEGEGGGFGVRGRPAGAYVIKGDQVRWQPAVDPNRVLAVLGMVAVAFLVSRPRVARARVAAAKALAKKG